MTYERWYLCTKGWLHSMQFALGDAMVRNGSWWGIDVKLRFAVAEAAAGALGIGAGCWGKGGPPLGMGMMIVGFDSVDTTGTTSKVTSFKISINIKSMKNNQIKLTLN